MPVSVHLPKIGMTMEDAVLTRWLVPDGATVTAGSSIFEMDIEKVLQDVETESVGTLNHLVAAGLRHFNLVFAGGDRLAQLARIAAEVIPAIKARAGD